MRVLLLLVTACWTNSQPTTTLPPPQTPEPVAPSSSFRPRPPRVSCRASIERLAEQLRPDFTTMGLPEPTMEALIETSIESCVSMDWSPDLMQCFAGVRDASEMSNCQQLMSQDQSDDLQKRAMEVIAKMGQLPPPPSPTP